MYKDKKDPRALESRIKHYRANKKSYVDRARARTLKGRAYLQKMKEDTPCKDCGKKYPYYVMDFDHRDPSEKLFSIYSSVNRSWDAMLNEIAKCDIVCANCHRERSHSNGHCKSGKKVLRLVA